MTYEVVIYEVKARQKCRKKFSFSHLHTSLAAKARAALVSARSMRISDPQSAAGNLLLSLSLPHSHHGAAKYATFFAYASYACQRQHTTTGKAATTRRRATTRRGEQQQQEEGQQQQQEVEKQQQQEAQQQQHEAEQRQQLFDGVWAGKKF